MFSFSLSLFLSITLIRLTWEHLNQLQPMAGQLSSEGWWLPSTECSCLCRCQSYVFSFFLCVFTPKTDSCCSSRNFSFFFLHCLLEGAFFFCLPFFKNWVLTCRQFSLITFIHFSTWLFFQSLVFLGPASGWTAPSHVEFIFGFVFFFWKIKIRAEENQGNRKKNVEIFCPRRQSEASSTLHQYALLCTCLLLLHIILSLIQFLHWHQLVQRSRSARLLSLHISFSSSPQLSATHLGLVTHDSWSALSKFNLRCDLGKGEKKKHISVTRVQRDCVYQDRFSTSFFSRTCAENQRPHTQALCTKGRAANRLNGEAMTKEGSWDPSAAASWPACARSLSDNTSLKIQINEKSQKLQPVSF